MRHDRLCLHLGNHPPETDQSYAEEDQAESGYYSAVLPDQIEAGATIENGLREADEVSRR